MFMTDVKREMSQRSVLHGGIQALTRFGRIVIDAAMSNDTTVER